MPPESGRDFLYLQSFYQDPMNKKTALLLRPSQLKKNGHLFELLHIDKADKYPLYTTEKINLAVLKKQYPKLPPGFFTSISRFTDSQVDLLKAELFNTLKKQQQTNEIEFRNLLQLQLERKLLQELQSLKPLLPLLSCYHQTPVAGDEKRLITAPCSFSNYTPHLRFDVRQSASGWYYLDISIELNGTAYPLPLFKQYGFLLEHKNEYFQFRFADYQVLSRLQSIEWETEKMNDSRFISEVLGSLTAYPVNRNHLLQTASIEVKPVGRVVLSELSGQFLMITPQFDYDGHIIEGAWEETATITREGKEIKIIRDKEAEKTIRGEIEQRHGSFANQPNGYYYLSFANAAKNHWFLKAFRHLLDHDIQVLGMDMLKHFRYNTALPVTCMEVVGEEKGWVLINFTLKVGKELISNKELQKILRTGEQALLLKDGSITLLDETWQKKYSIIIKHARIENKQIRVPRWVFIALDNGEQATGQTMTLLPANWKKKWMLWQQEESRLYDIPAIIRADLRPYQLKGYEWMRLLDEAEAGIFLADDMGLGKTLQTICYMAHIAETKETGNILIICPASLIYNWQNEISHFAPGLKTVVYHGSSREESVFEQDGVQIIISTYGTIRSDEEFILTQHFNAVVLDESHTIKNPASQITRLVHQLNAEKRVVLSGTPVMNNTTDLFSQLHFVLPGMFGSREFFKREYADPIDLQRDEKKMQVLKKLTAPFILRRTKEQVARDLPPKTEITLWCEMDQEQMAVYNDIKDSVKGTLSDIIKKQGLQKSKLQVLEGILKLRQLCNSPELLDDYRDSNIPSVKLNTLLDELENNLSDHKVLVFSQFTTMLDILSTEMNKRGLSHFMLTGATPPKERDRLVQTFNQEGQENRIFLLSLKAGNAGLNLTAADYVFLFDPWWNHAVEQQAIDRTHRIGQQKSVFAYKMICRDTIEEKIMQLQDRKKNLSKELIPEEEGFVKALSEEDVQFLFG